MAACPVERPEGEYVVRSRHLVDRDRRHDLAIRHPPLSSERKMKSMSYRPHPRADRALNQLERHGSGTPTPPTIVTLFLESPIMIQTARFAKAFEDAAPIVLRTLAQNMRNAGLPR